MLTIFSTPKPFRGHIGVIQRNAIGSWKRLHPDVEVILFGDDDGTAEVCRELKVRNEAEVRRNEHGTKYLNYIFERAQKIARHEHLCYANCDIIFTTDFWKAFERVKAWPNRFLMSGQRWDIELDEPLALEDPDWERKLMELVGRNGKQRSQQWIDYFLFSRGLYDSIPPLVIGRVHWDQWLIWKARYMKASVVDASPVVRAVHQNHDYSYHSQGAAGVWTDEQSVRNRELAGGLGHLYTLSDATHRLTVAGPQRNWLHGVQPLKRAIRNSCVAVWFKFLDITRPVRSRMGLRKASSLRH